MKIQLFSDLHNEFIEEPVITSDADVVVLAGDIHKGTKVIDWIKRNIPNKPVIYVLGNHCLWGGVIPKAYNQRKQEALGSNIHVLEKDYITIDGVNFLGATLWASYELFGHPRIAGSYCQDILRDHKKIRRLPGYSKLRTLDKSIEHLRSIEWLGNKLDGLKGQNNIVITHHAPSIRSIADENKDDLLSADYASKLEDFIQQHEINYWMHGHTHHSSDYMIGNTRVICNPKGYAGKSEDGLNQNFNPNFIVEV
jgi:Icc-related predicted phosphoesterase